MYRSGERNPTLSFRKVASQDEVTCQATDRVFDAAYLETGHDRTLGVGRYRNLKSGERVGNVADRALAQFRTRYADATITRDDIFACCYAALHDPVFRAGHAGHAEHAEDLRREFPRGMLHDDFGSWRDWVRTLLDLHIDYEKVKPFDLTRVDAPDARGRAAVAKLKSLSEQGVVQVDTATRLTGIPRRAWDYRLGDRSAITDAMRVERGGG